MTSAKTHDVSLDIVNQPVPGFYQGRVFDAGKCADRFGINQHSAYLTIEIAAPGTEWNQTKFTGHFSPVLSPKNKLRHLAEGIIKRPLARPDETKFSLRALLEAKVVFELITNEKNFLEFAQIHALEGIESNAEFMKLLMEKKLRCDNNLNPENEFCISCPMKGNCNPKKRIIPF